MDTIILNSSVLPDDVHGHDVAHFNYFILLDFFFPLCEIQQWMQIALIFSPDRPW